MDLEYLIRHESENTVLDFKAVQYRRQDDLLKDLIAMANALADGRRYIIIGVKVLPSGDREILGIHREEFVDDASYQELVRANIEPPLAFGYAPYELDGKLLGIFTIGPCEDPPYMMRKDFAPLKQGETWIRRGTSQGRLTRSDLDRLLRKKENVVDFASKLKVGFDSEFSTVIRIPSLGGAELPSERARETILQELEKARANPMIPRIGVPTMFGGVGYDGMNIEQLEQALETVRQDYYESDYYYLFGEHSHRLNITLLNAADRYLEDVTVELRIPRVKGLGIAETKPLKPRTTLDYMRRGGPTLDTEAVLYPEVEIAGEWFFVRNAIDDLRHGILTQAFATPVRIVAGPVLEGETVDMTYYIHARNLREPITGTLRMVVTNTSSETEAPDEK